eukprot:g1817.t1
MISQETMSTDGHGSGKNRTDGAHSVDKPCRSRQGGGKYNATKRVAAKDRFSKSRMRFLEKLKREKAARQRKKKFAERNKGRRGDTRSGTKDDPAKAMTVVRNDGKKVLKFDLKKIQEVDLTETNRALIMSILKREKVEPATAPVERSDVRVAKKSKTPSQKDLGTLIAMGFDQDKARQALHDSGGRVSDAADRLLGVDTSVASADSQSLDCDAARDAPRPKIESKTPPVDDLMSGETVFETASRTGVDRSLLVHLTQHLGFRRSAAVDALRSVGRIGERVDASSTSKETDEDDEDEDESQSVLLSALDWLCVNLHENELKGAFSGAVRERDGVVTVSSVSSSSSFNVSSRDVSAAVSDGSGGVSVARKYNFRNETVIYKLCKIGFRHPRVVAAVSAGNESLSGAASAAALEQWTLARRLLPGPPKDWKPDNDVSMDAEERLEAREDEIMALESILGDDRVSRLGTTCGKAVEMRWAVDVDISIPDRELRRLPTAKDGHEQRGSDKQKNLKKNSMTLEIWIPRDSMYPCEPPKMLLRDSRLPASFLLATMRHLAKEVTPTHATLAEPCVYAVVTWLKEKLLERLRAWLKTHAPETDKKATAAKKKKKKTTTDTISAPKKRILIKQSRHQSMKAAAKARYKAAAAREIEKTWTEYEKQLRKMQAEDETIAKGSVASKTSDVAPPPTPATVASSSSSASDASPTTSKPKKVNPIRRRQWADGLYFESHPELLNASSSSSSSSDSDDDGEAEGSDTSKDKNSSSTSSSTLPTPVTPSPLLLDIVGAIEETERLQPWLFKETSSSTKTTTTGGKEGANAMNTRLLKEHKKRKRSRAYAKMRQQRERLPAYQRRELIAKLIRSNQVCVVSGETGCGKTTQLPQIVLDDAIERGEGASCSIICTQPRRISAVGVADRVAEERTERVGGTVGYQIRLESKRSRHTRLLFCTTGVLLRRLQCDSDVRGVSHIFIDEVHERDLNSDFLLIILRGILKRRPSLKLVLMSATLNAELFADYFGGCPTMDIPGRAFPVQAFYLEDALELTGHLIRPGDDCAKRETRDKKRRGDNRNGGQGKGGRRAAMMRAVERATEESRTLKYGAGDGSLVELRRIYPASKYSASTLRSLMNVDESAINYALIEDLLRKLTETLPDGSILIFLSGLMDITKLYDHLSSDHRGFGDPKQFVLHPLHSTLTTAEQKRIFEKPPPGVRKIVISTNIAETSITIDDCVCVIDTGRVKENRYDHTRKMATLIQTWVSLASAKQRRGRAGRVRAGICYHLFSSQTKATLDEYTLPEMLRVPLEETVLQIKMLDLGAVRDFLGSAVNPPLPSAINDSLSSLRSMNALDARNGDALTPLGFHLATLPVSPRIGKMIVFAAIFKCLDPILTIAASLSFRSPFVAPLDKRDEADRAKRSFSVLCSDHLTLLRAFDGWTRARGRGRGAERTYCRANFLSRTTLSMIDEMRQQFFELLIGIGFVRASNRTSRRRGQGHRRRRRDEQWREHLANGSHNANARNYALVRAVITAGLYPNVLQIERPNREGAEPSIRARDGVVAIHPVSINFNESRFDGRRLLVYHEKVKSTKVYVRDCTAITPYSVMLFGGALDVHHRVSVVTVDDWLAFRASPKVAVLMKLLRRKLEKLLRKKIKRPNEDVSSAGAHVIDAVDALFASEEDEKYNGSSSDPAADEKSTTDRRLRESAPAFVPSRSEASLVTRPLVPSVLCVRPSSQSSEKVAKVSTADRASARLGASERKGRGGRRRSGRPRRRGRGSGDRANRTGERTKKSGRRGRGRGQ